MKLSIQEAVEKLIGVDSKNYSIDYLKFRAQSAPESKLAIPNLLKTQDLKFKEITQLAQKIKWSSYFIKGYLGETEALKLKAYSPEVSRMFIAESENKQLGFIRIVNRTDYFKNYLADQVWSISEVYVKPAYRGNAVATQLMHYVLKHYPVKSIYLETERFYKKQYFFNRIGFVNEVSFQNGMSRVYIAGMEEATKLVHNVM